MELEEISEAVEAAIQPAFRDSLLAKGQARSMIWRDGVLPEGAPRFPRTLSYDLLSYGTALLSHAMRLRERQGDQALARSAFERAGEAIEAVVSNGDPEDPQRGFLRLLSASSFHLARLSARAFSMLVASIETANLAPIERALGLLILRSLDGLEDDIRSWRFDGGGDDERLAEMLSTELDEAEDGAIDGESEVVFDALNSVLTDTFFSGLASFLVALQTGDNELVASAREELTNGLEECSALNLVSQWWCFRLATHLIDDLWQSSFHSVLPSTPPVGEEGEWPSLRSLFIASLFRRGKAEIELWPSQIDAARRAVDETDDLVVSLPTSAGKTRVAELCILRCLSAGKRVVFVTPLRALSAQTEVSLQRTFGPLGRKISALYGSIGTSSFENDTLKARDIVVATPEKLDFALRNDPSIIDDVGLIVLDEGHMIGLGEREVRYEVQIQRLLKREDAANRRIVCLSAILPDGEEFDDFVNWLRCDKEGGAVVSDWRPTRIRFGEVLWLGDHARLDLRIGDERPFVPTFFGQRVPTLGRRKALFPRDQRELVVATAWRLVEDGQSVLIYCPERRSVEPYARVICDLASKGFIDTALQIDLGQLENALAIGREWLGDDHPILACLQLGVAIHHGALPTPFRKEVERLLRDGALKITVSSPTLAQGLNLTATAVIMHDIKHFRDGERKLIEATEFKNVIGRAGRAFIDVEGLVLFPIFENHDYLRAQWLQLISSVAGHSMESGLIRLVATLLQRLNEALGRPDISDLQEYVLNNANAWSFPEIAGEAEEGEKKARKDWEAYLAVFDTALLSLLGEQELQADQVSAQLDTVLSSSLWQRRLARRAEDLQALLRSSLISRASSIWAGSTAPQRRGYFLAGVGLNTGHQLDAVAPEANQLLLEANGTILEGENDRAVEAITRLAELLFSIPPFVPNPFPDNWRDILNLWLQGQPIAGAGIDVDTDVLRFVENGLVYKLPWGMEAVRVRAQANGDKFGPEGTDLTIDDFEVGLAVPAVETGTLNRCAAMVVQAGFTSRIAAIKAVVETDADFSTAAGLKAWLESDVVKIVSDVPGWPTPESHGLWKEFRKGYSPIEKTIWTTKSGQFPVSWFEGIDPPELGSVVALHFIEPGNTIVSSADFAPLGRLAIELIGEPKGVFHSSIAPDQNHVDYVYQGPDDIKMAGDL